MERSAIRDSLDAAQPPRISLRSIRATFLLQPNAGLIAVGELDAGLFQGVLNGFDRARLQRLAGLQSCDRSRCDLRHSRKVAHAKMECGAGHSTLGAIYE